MSLPVLPQGAGKLFSEQTTASAATDRCKADGASSPAKRKPRRRSAFRNRTVITPRRRDYVQKRMKWSLLTVARAKSAAVRGTTAGPRSHCPGKIAQPWSARPAKSTTYYQTDSIQEVCATTPCEARQRTAVAQPAEHSSLMVSGRWRTRAPDATPISLRCSSIHFNNRNGMFFGGSCSARRAALGDWPIVELGTDLQIVGDPGSDRYRQLGRKHDVCGIWKGLGSGEACTNLHLQNGMYRFGSRKNAAMPTIDR